MAKINIIQSTGDNLGQQIIFGGCQFFFSFFTRNDPVVVLAVVVVDIVVVVGLVVVDAVVEVSVAEVVVEAPGQVEEHTDSEPRIWVPFSWVLVLHQGDERRSVEAQEL